MSDTFILVAGVFVFTLATLASLWAGYLSVQRAWVVDNPSLSGEDNIRPLVGHYEAAEPGQPVPGAEPAPPT